MHDGISRRILYTSLTLCRCHFFFKDVILPERHHGVLIKLVSGCLSNASGALMYLCLCFTVAIIY